MLKLENENIFIIETLNQSDENIYVQKAMLNGQALHRRYITHEEIMKGGGKLTFYMGNKPNKKPGF